MKTLKTFATMAAMLLCCVISNAQTLVDGIYYSLNSSSATATVTYGSTKYSGDIVIPETITYGENVYTVTAIGSSAFYGCSNLKSIAIPKTVTNSASQAFDGCSALSSVYISSLEAWCKISFNSYYGNPLNYAENLYLNGNLVTDLEIPNTVTKIRDYAFKDFDYFTSVTIPESVTSIGEGAFNSAGCELKFLSSTPATLASTSCFSSNAVFIVPESAYNTYCSAPYWSNMKNRITKNNPNLIRQNVSTTGVGLYSAIGEGNLGFVVDLTISGTIDSYDFMILRNKMPLLRHLNMENATIVANDYEHYTGYHTEDNKFPGYGLYGCKLKTLVLPKNIVSIGTYAIYGNQLLDICIPEDVATIGTNAFYGCSNLKSVEIPKGVQRIEGNCFQNCGSLTSLMLPPSITYIGNSAFYSCSQLTEVHLPSSLRSLGDNAFNSCSKLKDVFVYVVEPISIGQNTFTKFGNNFISTLHAPRQSYNDYYWDTQWSQFLSFAEFEGTYDNFYLEGDKTLDNETGSLKGEDGKAPDAELGENSGIIVGGDVNQNLGDVDVEHDGENGGSIIVGGDGEVNFENLTFHINVQGGRWYFFCFPFDVRSEDIKCENGADWVFRYYDGEERANNGKGGWKNVTSDGNGNFLKAATGYIFQCSKNDVLTLTAKNGKIKKEEKYNELKEHVTQNMQDASWNFVGNPYLSYYEITQDDYSAPITVWDGKKYIAIRPGDENYTLAPFEAFFVQKPSGTNSVNYNPDNQKTYNQTKNNGNGNKARMAGHAGTERLLVNITLSDGKETDRTRVVFNEKAAMDYELECDASKFSTEGMPQLYTLSTGNVMYAINERPMAQGCINLGFSVPAYGKYTIEGQRMDIGMLLMDNITGEVHDLSKGGYEFTSQAGTFNSRFTLVAKADATGINETENGEDADNSTLYNIKGQQVKTMEQGEIYIKNNVKVTKN